MQPRQQHAALRLAQTDGHDAAIAGLDAFVGSFITDVVVAEAGMDEAEQAFAAAGTGAVDGEAVAWVVAGGVDAGNLIYVFAAQTATATTCSAEMATLLE